MRETFDNILLELVKIILIVFFLFFVFFLVKKIYSYISLPLNTLTQGLKQKNY